MTTYEHVRHADRECQRQVRAVEVASRALVDATETERLAYLESVRQPVQLADDVARSEIRSNTTPCTSAILS